VRGEKIMTVATASIAQINTPTEVLIYRRVFSGMLNARLVTFFVCIDLLDEKNKAEATEFESPSGPWVLLAAVCVNSPALAESPAAWTYSGFANPHNLMRYW
jgi:hypothetical protein